MQLICGLFRLDGAPSGDDVLRAMASQMDVRLPPAWRLWRDGPVGLAVLDFAARGETIRPLPATDRTVLAADVRLDDPKGLAQTIEADPQTADEDLLIGAIERFGPSGLDRVFGDFALAHWNSTTRHLLCARDVFGVRPFAYVHQPGTLFAFASFPRALHGSGIVPARVDEHALVRGLVRTFRFDDCLVSGIARLPPAHVLDVSRDGLVLTRYWQLDRSSVGTRRGSAEEAARELRRRMEDAVACRLPRSGEIGAHLSGGLDSSAVAVLAARRLRASDRRLHAYSFIDRRLPGLPLEDETEFVEAVLAAEPDIDWTPIPPGRALPPCSAPIDADTPLGLAPNEPEHAVCARAEAQGIGLLLSGWGGDEAASFNGRGTFTEFLLRGRWRTLIRELSAFRRERGVSMRHMFVGEILSYLLPASIIGLGRRLKGHPDGPGDGMAGILAADVSRALATSPDAGLQMAPDGRENRWRLITSPHIAARTEVWAAIGARHGLAFAFPLLDRRVVEYALSLPSELFLRGGFRRRVFRDAVADLLPPKVRLRHAKYRPFPSRPLDLADRRDELLARIDGYARSERVGRLLDLASLRRLVEQLPSSDRARLEMRERGTLASGPAVAAVARALAAAAYLDWHGSVGPRPD